MESDSKHDLGLHFDVLPIATKKALDFLSKQDWLGEPYWYLAGGTALALKVGHRKSFDLDFFTSNKDFDNNDILRELTDKEWVTTVNRKNTLYGELMGAKISFIAYPFFIPKQKLEFYGHVKILDPMDIAVMKIIAISQRGKKRDFFDLYWCNHNLDTLENIIRRLPNQYPTVVHDYQHILKAITYFEDAENDSNPEIFFDANWKRVKEFFIKEVPIVAKRLIGID